MLNCFCWFSLRRQASLAFQKQPLQLQSSSGALRAKRRRRQR